MVRPWRSGTTQGCPSFMYATSEFVVPRSIPTIRAMAKLVKKIVLCLSDGGCQIVDDVGDVCSIGEQISHLLEEAVSFGSCVTGGLPSIL